MSEDKLEIQRRYRHVEDLYGELRDAVNGASSALNTIPVIRAAVNYIYESERLRASERERRGRSMTALAHHAEKYGLYEATDKAVNHDV